MDKPASNQSVLQSWVIPLVANIALPIGTYFVLVGAGVGEVPALLLSGVWPAAELAWTLHRQRHVDEFSVFVLLGLLAGIATTVFSDDARAVFLKDSITTGVIGLAFLVTLVVAKPLTFYFGRRFATDGSKAQRDWWDGLWGHPDFRSLQRRLTTIWGLALVGEAVIRAVLTWRLGTGPMVVVNNVVPYVVIIGLITLSVTAGRRAQAGAQRRGLAGAEPPPAAANP
ncbi:VC0807 family protein [Cryptosporangium arvum]|uniref:VC0807 family protein n=1 Tax=Cryptosporangium arvum TaxID=80871 RepID=UPI0004B01F2D|nr:VC0807 family protein [Cryptosporangium arvum]